MQHLMFAIYDSKTEAYSKPFYSLTKGEAIRTFQDAVNSPDSMFYKHPGDFTLFNIGSYDDDKATLDNGNHENLGCAITFKTEVHDAQ